MLLIHLGVSIRRAPGDAARCNRDINANARQFSNATMSESARLNGNVDPRSARGEVLRAAAIMGFAAAAAAASWTFSGTFQCETGVVAAALVLVGWRGYFIALAGVAVVSALLTPELDRAALHLLGTALAGAATGALLRRMDGTSSGQRRRTLVLVLASGVGALIAAIVALPTGAFAGTVELWIGVWAGTLFSAALLFGLFDRSGSAQAATDENRVGSDAHARAVIDNAVDAIAIIDSRGTILSFNRAAYRMFGYEADEVIGSNVNMLMPEPHRTRHDSYLMRYITTNEPRIIGVGRELDARRKDGTSVPIHLSVSEVIVQGQRTFTGVMRDISVERADKEEIRRQNERLSVTVRNAPMGIVTYRFGGTFTSTNRAFETMIGYTNDELARMNFAALTHPDDRTELKRLTDDAHEGRLEQFSMRLRLVRKSGVPVHVVTHNAITHDQHGVPEVIIVQVEDLTAEIAAKEAERMHQDRLTHVARLTTLGEMTAGIAHEINQPLTAISMYAQSGVRMLDAGVPKPERLREALEKLSAQSLRAGAVIDRVQRLVRKQESTFETVRINDLIGDILRLAESDARVNDMQIVLDLAHDLVPVNADPIQIQQVLLNLIRNGIDAMRSIDCRYGSVVTVRSRAIGGDRIEVSVTDRGTGVANDLAERMFTPFTTTKANGMGMGLSICRSIIDAHGGLLSYRNNPDHGATFYFQLPKGHSHEA